LIYFDHLKLIRGDLAEMKRYRTMLLSQQTGGMMEAGIMHEADDSCCRREPWNDTLARIVLALDLPNRQVVVNLNPPPS
jgi:hypothetical protein